MDVIQICEEYYNNTLPYLYSDIRSDQRYIFKVLAILFYAYAVIGFLLFLFTKKWVVYSKQKSITAALIYLIGIILATTGSVVREYIARDSFSCIAFAWIHHIPIVCFASQPVGLMYFYIYKLRRERMKTLAIKRMFSEDGDPRLSNGLDPYVNALLQKQKQKKSSKGILYHFIDFLYVIKYSKNGRIVVDDENGSWSSTTINTSNHNMSHHGSQRNEAIADRPRVHTLDILPHGSTLSRPNQQTGTLTSDNEEQIIKRNSLKHILIEQLGIPFMMITLFGFPYPIAIGLRVHFDPVYANGCHGCTLSHVDFFMKLTCGALFIPLAIQGMYAMRNEPDPLRIFQEIRIALFWAFIVALTWIVGVYFSYQGKGDMVTLNMIEMVCVCGVYYSFVVSSVVVALFEKRRSRNSQRFGRVSNQRSALSSSVRTNAYSVKNPPPPSALDLNLILLEPKARNALLEHSINEISSENVVFVFKLRAWKSVWDKEKPEKLTKIAIQLFKEYISYDSRNPINVSDDARSKLETTLQPLIDDKEKRLTTKPSKTLFDECERQCFQMIELDALPRFCRSELFKREILEGGVLQKILRR